MKIRITILSLIILIALAGLLYGRNQTYYSHGNFLGQKTFEIKKGEGNAQISDNLEKEGLISDKIYFYYYIRSHGMINRFLPGKYELKGEMTIPEIAAYITQEKNILPGYVKITFPEGWTSKQMADRLSENGFDGKEFLRIVNNPSEIVSDFDFLKDGKVKNLEGYLFPDTYFFAKNIGARDLILKILNNFDVKFTSEMRQKAIDQKKNVLEIIILASILEREVKTFEDRQIVAGIIKNRLKIGQPLQCDSTLAFILGDNKKQYSFAESRTDSPYNTYINKGLPPGPISNPGISAITAALEPQETQFNYFLSDPSTGNTIFSKNFEEHKMNKVKYGL